MKQITEIIDILSDENVNLENALIKTKVLMHRMGEQEAVEWINRELTGYSENDDLPDYRHLVARPMLRVTNGYVSSDMPAYIGSLPEDAQTFLNSKAMGQSITAIEHLASGDGPCVVWDIPLPFWTELSKPLSYGDNIEKAWSEITKSQLLEISTVIRSRLLDFVLKLEEKIPADVGIVEAKEKAKEVGAGDIFRNAVIGNNANVVINIGDNNIQTTNYSVVENDLEGLVKLLQENGVSEDDINALNAALENDKGITDLEPNELGPAVQPWYKAMLKKAKNGAWDIGSDVAEALLKAALFGYLGYS